MAGYYFGAGLMVKPSVVTQVTQATQQLAGTCWNMLCIRICIRYGLLQKPMHRFKLNLLVCQLAQHTYRTCGPAVSQPVAVENGCPCRGCSLCSSLWVWSLAIPSLTGCCTFAARPLAGQLTHAISQKMQRPGSTLPDSSSSSPGVLQQQHQQHLPGSSLQLTSAHSSLPTGPAAAAAGSAGTAHPAAAALFDGMVPSKQQRPADVVTAGQAVQQTDDPVVMRLLLQQQADIAALKKQNRQLRAAVCKLDPKAAVCRGWRGNNSSGKGSRNEGKASGEGVDSADDAWSE